MPSFLTGGPKSVPHWLASHEPLTLYQASGFVSRCLGLWAWQTWGERPRGLLFTHCQAVHTVGLTLPLDVLFMDECGNVLRVCHALAPWRWVWHRAAYAVIELPPGFCRQAAWQAQVRAAWCAPKIVA